MRKRSIILLVIIVVIFGGLVYFGMTGVQLSPTTSIPPLYQQVNLGLDLTGGGYVVYQANQGDLPADEFEGKFNTTLGVLRDRLDAKGYTEATVVAQGGNRIRIEIPNNKKEEMNDVFASIGTPSKLEFKDAAGNVRVTGDMVKSAQAVIEQGTNEIVVRLEFNSEGAKAFGDMTAEAYANGTNISIYVDDQEISSAGVKNGAIYGGSAVISGGGTGFTQEEAENLAVGIASGALPLNLEEIELRTISASLGEDALSTSLFAGLIGIIVLFVFMLIYYRLPGLMADIALAVYIFIILFLLAAIPAIQLTLPGIAGIILSVGMAVDANVIIFERFKEELSSGKTLRASLNAGFHKAMSTIIDSNITTIIAAIVIAIFGVGTVKGFGYTLIIGILVSMFTAIVITRALMKLAISLNIKNLKLYSNRKIVPEKAVKGGE